MSKLTEAHRQTQPVRLPSTKAELLERLRQRATPEAEMHLTPDGAETVEVAKRISAENERRIAQLREGLAGAHSELRVGFEWGECQ